MKVVLGLIVLFLGSISLRPMVHVDAAAPGPDAKPYYVHISAGYEQLPGGGEAQEVIDLRNGNVGWFPKDFGREPVFRGRYRLEAMDKPAPTK
jgi:hypothetical protein